MRDAIVLAGLILALAGCSSRSGVEFVPNGAPLTTQQVQSLGRTTDISSVASVKTADAAAARDNVLRDLRTRGSVGDRAASLLTRGFPSRTNAVPVLVRISDVAGTRALVVVEAYSGSSGTLTHRRLWVFDYATGAVILSESYR